MAEPKDHLVLGLDDVNWEQAEKLITDSRENIGVYRLNSLAQRYGWEHAVHTIAKLGGLTMADPKYYDTPDTVYTSVKDLVTYGATYITVHASGTQKMLQRSVEARDDGREAIINPHVKSRKELIGGILATTILTSHSEADCEDTYGSSVAQKVLDFTDMAAQAGVDGIVCSVEEVSTIRQYPEYDNLLVAVASIRPPWESEKPAEQKRSGEAKRAIEEGADLLFLGRQVRNPRDRVVSFAAKTIAQEITPTLTQRKSQQSPLAKRARKRTYAQ